MLWLAELKAPPARRRARRTWREHAGGAVAVDADSAFEFGNAVIVQLALEQHLPLTAELPCRIVERMIGKTLEGGGTGTQLQCHIGLQPDAFAPCNHWDLSVPLRATSVW